MGVDLVCWNCQKSVKIRNEMNEIIFYEPCNIYINKMLCNYVPEIALTCKNCANYNDGCVDGFSFGNPNCNFRLKDKSRQMALISTDNIRKDMCYVCPFRKTFVDNITGPCPECPIDWKAYGVNW